MSETLTSERSSVAPSAPSSERTSKIESLQIKLDEQGERLAGLLDRIAHIRDRVMGARPVAEPNSSGKEVDGSGSIDHVHERATSNGQMIEQLHHTIGALEEL